MNFPLFNERKRLADELSSRIGAMQHMVAGATRLQLTDPMFRQRATQVARVVPPNPHNRVDRNAPKRTPNGFQTTVQIPCAEAHLMEYRARPTSTTTARRARVRLVARASLDS